ncbi:ATP-dependent DNA helicase DinG [compost metagenome]
MLTHETLISRKIITEYATKHKVCPFEFSLDAAYAADVIICDYNYIFDPRVSLKRLWAEQKKHTALLMDEAHNLVDRAREMFSSSLNKSEFLALQREFKGVNIAIYQASKAINQHFITLRKLSEGQDHTRKELPQELMELVEAFVIQAEKVLASAGGSSSSGPGSSSSASTGPDPNPSSSSSLLLDTYFACQTFVRSGSMYDERYVTYVEFAKNEVKVKLFCLDPSHLLKLAGKGYRSLVYFSATLSPSAYYMDMLGGGPEDYMISIPSPFSKEQLGVWIQPLSTRYQDRERTKLPLVVLLQELIQKRPGNYLFFFPSYAYMNDVYEAFMMEDRGAEVLIQRTEMSEEEREDFLSAFAAGSEQALVGFAVMGGIFSEGIDLVGDRLSGVVIVGVGLPQLGLERNILKDYFQETGKNGYDYAYVYPGMNKVLQAGGRLIRSEQDRGLLVLVDDRYLEARYQRLLPEEWKPYEVIRTRAGSERLFEGLEELDLQH